MEPENLPNLGNTSLDGAENADSLDGLDSEFEPGTESETMYDRDGEDIRRKFVDKRDQIWTKVQKIRMDGESRGNNDLYVITPKDPKPGGIKLRSTKDLAQFIRKHDLFDAIDPRVINFEKLNKPEDAKDKVSSQTKQFISCITSKGTIWPKIFDDRPRKKPVKRNAPASADSDARPGSHVFLHGCLVDGCTSTVSDEVMALYEEDRMERKCPKCYIPKNPLRVLVNYFIKTGGVLPLAENVEMLHDVTNLSKDFVSNWLSSRIGKDPEDVKKECPSSDEGESKVADQILVKEEPLDITDSQIQPESPGRSVPALRSPSSIKREPDEEHVKEDENQFKITGVFVKNEMLDRDERQEYHDKEDIRIPALGEPSTSTNIPMPISIKQERVDVGDEGAQIKIERSSSLSSTGSPSKSPKRRKKSTGVPNWVDKVDLTQEDDDDYGEIPIDSD